VPDRAHRRSPELAHALGDGIGRGVDLIGLLVEKKMVVAEMRSGDVPVEVLRLQVEREVVRQQRIQRSRDVAGRFLAQAGGCVQLGGAPSGGSPVVHDFISIR
jgi:hypothetical protein